MTHLTDRFDTALTYARHVHGGQKRKGTDIPYFSHLIGVAGVVLEAGGDEDQAIAALLHDAVEDQGGADRLADIRLRFGKAVARIVEDCTDTDVQPKPPWEERKRAYLERLPHKAKSSLLVSLADKIYNAEAILLHRDEHGEAVWDRFTASKDQALWYYGALADAFDRLLPGPTAARFRRAVEALRGEA